MGTIFANLKLEGNFLVLKDWLKMWAKTSKIDLGHSRKSLEGIQTKTLWIKNDLSKCEEGVFESIFVELKLGNVNIICGALYRPPNKSNNTIDAFISILEETLNIVKKENKLLFLGGDFKFDLLGPDRHTDIFTDLTFEFGNIPLISKPTRISTVMTLLENIWTNNLKHPINSAIITDLVSGHFAVLQCIELPFSFTANLLNRLRT